MDQRNKLSVWVCDDIVRGPFRLAARFIDVMLVPWLLEADVVFAYLTARMLSLLVPLSLTVLEVKALPQLVVLARIKENNSFQAAAARVNLGYLMVCGSVSLITLLSAPYLTNGLGISNPQFKDILIWLMVGQSAPILFGATRLLMRVVDSSALYDLLSGLTAVLFLIGLMLVTKQGGVIMAQTFAAAQLAQAGICACFLTQRGVWPGLTALFHKEIKLF